MQVFGRYDLAWDGPNLCSRAGTLLATVAPDTDWPNLYRVRLPDGRLTDMVNLSRAKDAALSLASPGCELQKLSYPSRIFARASLEFLQQVEVVAVRVLKTDHAGAPGLVFRRAVERYSCGP